MPRHLLIMLTALVPGLVGPAAADQNRPPERGADLLAIDFSVVASDGSPVTDLKPDDISLRLGGRRRTIRSLQLISTVAPAGHADLPPPFATNADSETGRRFALILDDDSFKAGQEGPLRDAVTWLIGQLTPRDRLSLVTMPYGGVKVPFTTDHGRVRVALGKLVGQATGSETGSELACRTRQTLESLIHYFDLQGIRDAPLTVMFVTGGLAAPRRDAPVMLAPGKCELRAEAYQQVGEAAGAARANFYVIQPVAMMLRPAPAQQENIAGVGFIGSDNPMEGLEHLAGTTGGKMLNLTGSGDGALGRVLRESAAYYLATVNAEKSDRSNRSQQMELRVSRAGVELRTRPNATFAKLDGYGSRPVNPSARDMLRVATVFRDLPLRASAYVAPEPSGHGLRVVAIAESDDPSVRFATLVAALVDVDGRLVSNWSATNDELQRSPVVGAMPAEPGAYRLRVAAIDQSGRAGTADYEFEVDHVQTGPLRLSSVILGLAREKQFVPRLQFNDEPVAIAYLEMSGAPSGTKISAVLELATTANGPAIAVLPLTIESAGDSRYVARAAVPLGALAPGDYVARAIVGLEGHPPTRVIRTLRKTSVKRPD